MQHAEFFFFADGGKKLSDKYDERSLCSRPGGVRIACAQNSFCYWADSWLIWVARSSRVVLLTFFFQRPKQIDVPCR